MRGDTNARRRSFRHFQFACRRFETAFLSLLLPLDAPLEVGEKAEAPKCFADAADASSTRRESEMLRQTSPKAASGSTGFAMLPSAHRKPERRDSKAFKVA